MFKLVVLCIFAAVVAEPDPALLYGSPLAYASYPGVIPTTTITKQSSLIAHPSPIVYSTPYGYSHFIKKRSADPEPEPTPEAKPDPLLLSYGSPLFYPKTYSTPVITNPWISGYSGYSAFPYSYSHLIKKRSADPEPEPTPEAKPDPQLLSYSSSLYYPKTYSTPVITNPWISGYSGYSAFPYSYSHLIKKRSADPEPEPTPEAKPDPQLLSYASSLYYPKTYSTPVITNPWISGYSAYSAYPYSYSHLIKKRSADPEPEPTPEAKPDPQLLSYTSSLYYPKTYSTPVITNPWISGYSGYSAYPYSYSHLIKKRSTALLTAPTYYAAGSPLYSTYSAASPLVSTLPYYTSPYAYSTYIKK